jgi:hypothetical protein
MPDDDDDEPPRYLRNYAEGDRGRGAGQRFRPCYRNHTGQRRNAFNELLEVARLNATGYNAQAENMPLILDRQTANQEPEQLLTVVAAPANGLESPDGSSSRVTFLSVSKDAGGPIMAGLHIDIH